MNKISFAGTDSTTAKITFSDAELSHHMKYIGTAKRRNSVTGKMENYVPTPAEVVTLGLESPGYLEQFK